MSLGRSLRVTRRRWIVNASPLIFLSQIESLSLLKELADEILVPVSVRNEVLVPKSQKLPIKLPDWLSFREDLLLPVEIAGWDLGAGESQVLAHALVSGDEAVLDDYEGRQCARALGVPVTGTVGVILRAKKSRLIPAARPLVEELLRKGLYLSKELAAQALREVGE
jgi:predicted nucleic acid-binding protein